MYSEQQIEWLLRQLYAAAEKERMQTESSRRQAVSAVQTLSDERHGRAYDRVLHGAQSAIGQVHHVAFETLGTAAGDETQTQEVTDVSPEMDSSVDDDIFGSLSGPRNKGTLTLPPAATDLRVGQEESVDGASSSESGQGADDDGAWGPDVFTIMGDFEACGYSKHAQTLGRSLTPVVFVSVPMSERANPGNARVRKWLDTYPEHGTSYFSLPRVSVPRSYAPLWLDAEQQKLYNHKKRRGGGDRGVFIGGATDLQHFVSEMSLRKQ